MTTPSISTEELIKQASSAYLAGNVQQAHNLLTQAIRQEPSNTKAWVWLAEVVSDPQQKQQYYEKALQLDPTNIQAQQGLKALLPPPPPEVKSTLNFRQLHSNQPATRPSKQPILSIPEGQLTISWKEKLVRGNVPYQQWIKALVLPKDHIAKNKQRRALGFAVSGVGLVASLIGLFTSNTVVIGVGLLWFIAVLGVTLSKTPLNIIESQPITEIVIPFLKMLQEDLDPKKSIEMSIDLSDIESKSHLQGKHSTNLSSKTGFTDQVFVNAWFNGQARMLNGMQLRWTITDNLRKRTVRRKNRNGKLKSKTKRKIKRSVSSQLMLKNVYVPSVKPHSDPISEVAYDQAKQKLIAQLKLGQAPSSNATVIGLLTTIGDMYRFIHR